MEILEKPPLDELVKNIFGNEDCIKHDVLEHSVEESSVADEILSYFGHSDSLEEDELMHYGVARRSGRYPYGSGDNSYQHSRDFLGRIDELKKSGFTFKDDNGKTWTGDNAIAKSMGLTSSEYRRQVSWAGYERRLLNVETAKRLRDKEGMGATEIGREMGVRESTVRSWLNPKSEDKMQQAMNTVNFLRKQVDEKGMLDVGTGVDTSLGISKERLELALDYLSRAEGYPVYGGGVPQVNSKGQQTNQKVLCVPGTKNKEIYEYDRVKTIDDYASQDQGDSFKKKFTYPESLDSKRMKIRYNEEGGLDRDGLIELRRGVQDLNLGESSNYSQVRILVDKSHYLKGMAVYSDDMPDGVDVVFNTNKTKGTPMQKVLKEIKKEDPENPFGSLIKDADKGGQYWYTDKKTGKEKLGLINKRSDEGDWNEWADTLPSQFLGKQTKTLAKKQLDLAKKDKLAEFDEYMSINNPTIKKHMLEKFADDCDASAVHLKAAALPGQKYHVIIPINTLKDNEIYAPGYEPGSKLALVRYPHGGIFEIPILTVNNKNPLGKKVIGPTSVDAVGINHKIADQLSGADFDGDTVMCIPTHDSGGKVKIANKASLKQLKGFDPKLEYGGSEKIGPDGKTHYYRKGQEYPRMKNTQTEMGKISNLITDMTLGGATEGELARAVKHSMVVIDAEKHKLDYKSSYIENNIDGLRKSYQIGVDKNGNTKYGGASTILSRSKGEVTVDKRQGSYKINTPGTKDYDSTKPVGAKLWKQADDLYYPDRKRNNKTGMIEIKTTDGKKVEFDPRDKTAYEKYNPVKRIDPETKEVTYTNKAGDVTYKLKKRGQESTKMAETDDAYSLVSKYKHPMELLYADYANDMKVLGNKARAEMIKTGKINYDAAAKAKYSKEVEDLMRKIDDTSVNKIKERQAHRTANAEIERKKQAYEEEHDGKMKGEDLRKISQRALSKARNDLGSISRRDRNIIITDREWEAIQAGAVSETKLKQILNNTDVDKLRERATPKLTNSLSPAQVSRAKAMAASNYTLEQIASKLGISTSTASKYLKGVK